jgi:hypothetical protein
MKLDLLRRAIIDAAAIILVLWPLLFFWFKTGGM